MYTNTMQEIREDPNRVKHQSTQSVNKNQPVHQKTWYDDSVSCAFRIQRFCHLYKKLLITKSNQLTPSCRWSPTFQNKNMVILEVSRSHTSSTYRKTSINHQDWLPQCFQDYLLTYPKISTQYWSRRRQTHAKRWNLFGHFLRSERIRKAL